MANDKSLAAEIEAVMRKHVVARIWPACGLSISVTFDGFDEAAAEIAALQSRAFKAGARKGLSDALSAYDAAERELATAEAVYEETSGRMTETAGIGEIMDRIGAEVACMRCSAAGGIAQAKLVEAVRAALAPNTTEGRTDRA